MVSAVIKLTFQTVSQKWLDGPNSNLACGCNWFSGVSYFKVTLTSQTLYTYVEFLFPDSISKMA